MLSDVMKKYQNFKKTNQKSLETLRQKLQQNFEQKTIQALKIQNHKVSKIHSNQQQIENRLRRNNQLQQQIKVHLGGWTLLYEELNKSLKEAGHLVNYAEYVHEEIRQIGAELANRKRNQQQKLNTNAEKEKEELNGISNRREDTNKIKQNEEKAEKIESNQNNESKEDVCKQQQTKPQAQTESQTNADENNKCKQQQ